MQQLVQRLPSGGWRAKKRFRLWRREHRHHLRLAGIALLALLALLEVFQLLYPSDRLLPFVTVEGQKVGGKSIVEATAELETRYKGATLTVKTDTAKFDTALDAAGIAVDVPSAVKEAAAYPMWQRVIPLSSVAIGIFRDGSTGATFADERLGAFAAAVEQKGHTDAVNASIQVKNGRATLIPSTPAKDYPAAQVVGTIKKTHFAPKTMVAVTPKTTAAPLTDAEAESMVDEVQELVNAGLAFTLNGEEIKPSKGTRGDWMTFSPDATLERLEIGLNSDLVSRYLISVQGDAYKAPGTTHVQLIDDREVSRAVGPSGRGVDAAKATAEIHKAITAKGDDTVALDITDLPPILAYDKKYSNTDAALASLVSGAASSRGGYGVSLMEIDGRSANANGNKRFVAASTYKLYVAYAVVKEVEAGRMSWEESLGARTVAKCFDDMIVVSDNSCPVAFGSRIGWRTITNTMHELGLSDSTQLGSTMYTTSNDLAYFLYRLEKGSLLSKSGRDRLIDAMKRQSYTRAGIPRGVGGVVADKVGEVDGYYHDAAIVYGSKKTYILVVMTYGGSWAGIADVAAQVHASVNK
jgi:beta-lactamase class A